MVFYDAFITGELMAIIKVNGLSVLIKETFRSKRFKNQPSFLESNGANLKLTEIFTSLDTSDSEDESEEGAEETA